MPCWRGSRPVKSVARLAEQIGVETKRWQSACRSAQTVDVRRPDLLLP